MSIKQGIGRILSPFAKRVLHPELQALKEKCAYYAEQSKTIAPLPLLPRHALLDGIWPADDIAERLPADFSNLFLSGRALWKLIREYEFQTVLDIGCGEGLHAAIMLKHGKTVTALDYGESPYFKARDPKILTVIGDFNEMQFPEPFDCVWASHVLEHQPNPNMFLRKIHAATREGGVVAISVPPLKHQIVGGHVSLWNGGLLLYHLVLAGFDCREASILQYGYNISVILKKRSISTPGIIFDTGDIRNIRPYLPERLPYMSHQHDDPFDGNIQRLNW